MPGDFEIGVVHFGFHTEVADTKCHAAKVSFQLNVNQPNNALSPTMHRVHSLGVFSITDKGTSHYKEITWSYYMN